MRHAIETAPRGGEFVLLEDDASGRYTVARWSAEAGDWVQRDGKPTQITATHWYPVPPDKPPVKPDDGSSASLPVDRPASWACRLGALAPSSSQRQPIDDALLQGAENGAPADAIQAWSVPLEDPPARKVRPRALLTIATFALVALLGLSFAILGGPAIVQSPLSRSEVPQQTPDLARDVVPQLRADSDGTQAAATDARQIAETTGLAPRSREREQRAEPPADELAKAQRIISDLNLQLRERASELEIARRETEMHAAQSNKTAGEKAQLMREAESTAALARELASQLAMTHREIDAPATPARDASAETAQIKQSAESTAAELQQSLQWERDRAKVLANDLAAARREINAHAKLSSKVATNVKQTKRHLQRKRDRDFGLWPLFHGFR